MNLSVSFEQGWFWTTLVLMVIGYLFGTLLFSRLWISVVKRGDATFYDKRSKKIKTQTTFGTTATGERGIQFGAAQFILDFGKPLLFWFLVVRPLFLYSYFFSHAFITFGLVGVIAGNNFPIWWNFKGGQGIAVGVGSLFCVNWLAGLVGLTAWAIWSGITGSQTWPTFLGLFFGSLVALIPASYMIPGIPYWYDLDWTATISIIICFSLVAFAHLDDYKRKYIQAKEFFKKKFNRGNNLNG